MEKKTFSTFTPTNVSQQELLAKIAQQKAADVIQKNYSIELAKVPHFSQELPPFISLLINIFISLVRDSNSNNNFTENFTSGLFSNVISTHIKLPLLKLIAGIIQKKLYKSQNQNFDNQISYGFIFKNYLLGYFISVVSENSCNVGIDKILTFQKTLMGQSYIVYIPIYLYFAYGGGLFTIQSGRFRDQLIKMITSLGKILSSQETIVTRNLQAIKAQKQRNAILSESLNIACISKNRSFLEEIVSKITFNIFKGKDYISKEDFINRISQLETNEVNIMTFYFVLLRTQFQIVESKDFGNHIFQKSTSQKPSFYSMEMQKILKKCPYNGDEKCDCKKCQCVRRNRESAKISQQKKRNAVQQIEPMKKRIDFLQKRNTELQEENMVLKGLLNEIKGNPLFQSLLRKTMEPISKILNE